VSTKTERQNGGHKRECRVRRMLKRQGFLLRRNTTRDRANPCNGRYRIIDGEGHSVFGGGPREFNLSLDTAEAWAMHAPKSAALLEERKAA